MLPSWLATLVTDKEQQERAESWLTIILNSCRGRCSGSDACNQCQAKAKEPPELECPECTETFYLWELSETPRESQCAQSRPREHLPDLTLVQLWYIKSTVYQVYLNTFDGARNPLTKCGCIGRMSEMD